MSRSKAFARCPVGIDDHDLVATADLGGGARSGNPYRAIIIIDGYIIGGIGELMERGAARILPSRSIFW